MFGNPRHRVAQTGGRSWDGGLQVYNNPIPRWWLGLLLTALLFALGYWLFYPSWPLPTGPYNGLLEVELDDSGGGSKVVSWSSAAELQALRERGPGSGRQQRLETAVMLSDFHMLVDDSKLRNYVLAVARVPFLDHCAACHGDDGHGAKLFEDDGSDTNLATGAWRRNASFGTIKRRLQAYSKGSHGGNSSLLSATDHSAQRQSVGQLSPLQLKALVVYVYQLGR